MITPEQFIAIVLPTALLIATVFAYTVYRTLGSFIRRRTEKK